MSNDTSPSSRNSSTFNLCQFYLKARERDNSPQAVLVLTGVINALFSLVAVVGNSLILTAIWKNASLRTPSYILLAGLAATDFSTGFITQPLYVAYFFARTNCIVIAAADIASRYFATVTAETITIMSVERWSHMSRRSLITERRTYTIYGALASLSAAHVAARLFLVSSHSYLRFVEPLLYGALSLVCFSTTTFCYFKVFGIIRNQQRQIQAKLPGQNVGRQPSITSKYKRSVYTVLYILVIFLLCYSPHAVCICIHVLLKMSAEAFHITWHLTATLILISSSLNPLLYCWRIKEIREEVKRIIPGINSS